MPKILSVTHLKTTKRNALLGQLRRAILIYFEGEDYASVTTLAGAATQLAADLLTASRKLHVLPVRTGAMIKPEIVNTKQWKDIKDKLKRLEGFFKHADRKGENTLEAQIEFPIAQVASLVFEACEGARQLGIRDQAVDLFWSYWTMVLNPSVIDASKMPDDIRLLYEQTRELLCSVSRSAFAEHLKGLPKLELYGAVLSNAKEIAPKLSPRRKA